MKKLLFLLVSITTLFASCSKENQNPNNPDRKDLRTLIIGKWKPVQIEAIEMGGEEILNGGVIDIASSPDSEPDELYSKNSALIFRKDGTRRIFEIEIASSVQGKHSGTYRFDGETIVVYDPDEKNELRLDVLSITKTECTFKIYDNTKEEFVTVKYKKA